MQSSWRFGTWLVLLAGCLTRITAGQELGEFEQNAINAATARAGESVVQIETVGGLERVGRLLASSGATSGVVVSEDGYIISSAFNFITQPASIIVTLADGTKHAATIVSRDRSRMIVLLKIDTEQPLVVPTPVTRDEMRVGQWTIAVGKTYDPATPNVSIGILSADDRIWGRAIQTDAKVSPVNYGGALADIRGNVLGILVPLSNQSSSEVAGAELYDSGIGFAIPLVDVFEQLGRMKTGEELKPGLMGITAKAQSLYAGPMILGTCPIRSPAAEAGLKVGDELVSANGQPVRHQADLKQVLGRLYAGDVVKIVARRDGVEIDAQVELTDKVAPYLQPSLGVLADEGADEPGLTVRYVFERSPAADAGLQSGDRLVALDEIQLDDVESWREAVLVLEPNQAVKLTYIRGEQRRNASLELSSLIDDANVPEAIPLAAGEPHDQDAKIADVEIPEEEMQCQALVPEVASASMGLLVWLPANPSAIDDELLKSKWAAMANQYRFIVMFPKPGNENRWEPAELLVIRKLMDEAIRSYRVDRNRVALAGVQTGGAVAYRLSAINRDIVRGVCVADARVPRRTPIRGNDPIERISYLLLSDESSEGSKEMAANAEALRTLKLPVSEHGLKLSENQLDEDTRAVVARWCDALGRL